MYRRLIIAVSLLGCAAATPAQRTLLRADETAYELRGPDQAKAGGKQHIAHGVGSPHGDLVRPELGGDVLDVPPSIPSSVRPATLIQPIDEPPGTAAPDTVGAFRFMCEPGQISYDDPIVYPNQPGKSHLHQFFGNTGANANSTYRSLRTTGDSTCVNILNRSAYWMPAMLDGRGHVVRPDYVSVYYKRLPKDSAECRRQGKECVALPRGLRFIFGYDMVTGTTPTGGSYFDCTGPTAKPGRYKTITEAAANCPAGNRLGAIVNAPGCWDGTRLDSPNHREHMANPSYGSWGYLRCPSTHPYVVPSFTLGSWYTVDAQRADTWYLSSDEMPGMARMPAGSTFHADWFGAWDDDVMAMWTADCLDALKSCNSGVLGGRRMMKPTAPFAWTTPRRLVPIPPRPGAPTHAGQAVAAR
ncbi:MAG: DUF1996 domain-containing protein [Sphingomonas phyllosphaerae]